MKRAFYTGIFILFSFVVLSQNSAIKPPVLSKAKWVDSVYQSLSLEERVAQLFIIRAHSDKTTEYHNNIAKQISAYNVGGLCFFQGTIKKQASLTKKYQKLAKTPLLITQDAEWGLGMRLSDGYDFPYNMTVGATQNDLLAYEMGAKIAEHLKAVGVHINFAPVVDINNNMNNPVIGIRSFGESPGNVISKAFYYMTGLQENGIIATAKHFPGHGDTESDSHHNLPIIKFDRERLDSLELMPFKQLTIGGLDAIMSAHLYLPKLDSTKNIASSLSKPIITGILKNDIGFQGLIVTDALEMKGVSAFHSQAEIVIKAFEAGNDILLMPLQLKESISALKKAIQSNRIDSADLAEKCHKILAFKYDYVLSNTPYEADDSLVKKLNGNDSKLITQKIYEQASILLKNENDILPIYQFENHGIVSVAIGTSRKNTFQKTLEFYEETKSFHISKDANGVKIKQLLSKLKDYEILIVSIHNNSIFPSKKYGITSNVNTILDSLSNHARIVLDVFAMPYALTKIDSLQKYDAIIVSHEDNETSQRVSAQLIFGVLPFLGKLPVSINQQYKVGDGMQIPIVKKLGFSIPEAVGLSSDTLSEINIIVQNSINQKMFPGCQILIAKDGQIVHNKSYGYHTYDKKRKVHNSHLYDLASITKIAATTLSIMKLHDDAQFDIDRKLSDYLPYLRNSNKRNIFAREIMSHQAMLKPWIPFYLSYMDEDEQLDEKIFSKTKSSKFDKKVANHLFVRNDMPQMIRDSIVVSELTEKKRYRYSDLGYYLLKDCIENITSLDLNDFVTDNFYKPLKLRHITYRPKEKFSLRQIVPTENEELFRKQLVHGYVHDQGAALHGGVQGHAGLFSNASDLAVIMQMLLQGGNYGGIHYINENTIREFTKTQFPLNHNRKAIGFDKPMIDLQQNGPTCHLVSHDSYGHSGFTGTYVWADPKFDLIYIFLSNRIHPDASNKKLIRKSIRSNIQEVIYKAIINDEK